MGTQKIPVFNGNQVIGYLVQGQGNGKLSGKEPLLSPPQMGTGPIVLVEIKNTTLVRQLNSKQRQIVFRHREDISGRRAIVYSRTQSGDYDQMYEGVAQKKENGKTNEFILTSAAKITPREW
jgi:hypothetical protein